MKLIAYILSAILSSIWHLAMAYIPYKRYRGHGSRRSLRKPQKLGMRVQQFVWELLHHGRRAGIEKTTQIRVVSGEKTFILHI